jgi:catechol 2,3-dioxygenase-like lactoylglutathione lyase family enzyme
VTIAFDHMILLVRDLEMATRDFREMGFVVAERDDAEEGAMANRFVSFADGSYILLSAFRDPASATSHRLAPLLAEGEGWTDYSYRIRDVAGAAERLREAGLPLRGPLRVGNQLASGEPWSLDLLLTGIGAGGEEALPFLVEDREGRNHRIPAPEPHPNGVRGIVGVRLRVASEAPVLQALAAMLGQTPQLVDAGRSRVRCYQIDDTWLEIEEDETIPLGRGRLAEVVLTGDRKVLPAALLHGAALRFE